MIKKYLSLSVSIVFAFLFSVEIQKALTLHTKFRHTLALALAIFIFKHSRYLKYSILLILLCIFTYWPISHNYGQIDASQIASLLQSNSSEIVGFLPTIPIAEYLFTGFLIIACCIYFLYPRTTTPYHFFIKLLALYLFFLTLHHTHASHFFRIAYHNYDQENQQLIASQHQTDTWTITANNQNKKTIVVVIGESVRKDYLSVYGYPLSTTPFLNTAPGLFIDGYISASFNTVDSLSRTLTQSNGSTFEMNNSVVTLANKAGFDTSWISNQGYIGKYDTPAASIAIKSHYYHFNNKGDFLSQTPDDDDDLLPYLKEALTHQGKKVIFLHMAGSHENVCKRLFDTGIQFHLHQGKQLDCYVSSIKRLDSFLEKTYNIVAANSHDFSIIYFSDHGLTIKHDTESGTIIKHGNSHHQNYEVPFIILGSEFHTHQYRHIDMSAIRFPSLFASELGIQVAQLPDDNIDHPNTDKAINVWDGTKLISFSSLKDNYPMQ